MNIPRLSNLAALGMMLALVLSPAAMATAATDASVRGQLNAIFAYCTRVYPEAHDKLLQLQNSLIGVVSDGEEHAIERSAAYRQAFDFVSDALANTPHAQGLEACKAAVKS